LVDTNVSDKYILSIFRVLYNEDKINTFVFLKEDGNVSSKSFCPFIKLHGITYQRAVIFTVTSVIT
jgi:hypothetical protein